MKSNILKRKEHDLKKAISLILIKYIDNPDLKNIVISRVEIDSVSQTAHVFYSSLYDQHEKTLQSLNKSRTFIQKKLALTHNFRSIPKLRFIYDKGYEHSSKIESILSSL